MAETYPESGPPPWRGSIATARLEQAYLVVLTIAAWLLRSLELDQNSISHFDEGVYLLWGVAGDYPAKEFFAPPLVPTLIGWLTSVLGAGDAGPRLVSSFFGAATVPAVWWVSRRWYGPSAAVASASMAALSAFHIEFSRMALTDVTFTFWFVLSIGLTSVALFENGARGQGSVKENGFDVGNRRAWTPWPASILAGISAGAALNTKYNGALVLVIAGLAFLIAAINGRYSARQLPPALARLAVIVAIAVALYLPWLLHVHDTFGYSTLIAHHRGYSTGFGQWFGNLSSMIFNQQVLAGLTGVAGPVVGLIAAVAVGGRFSLQNVALLILVAVSGLLMGDGVGWTVGLAGLWLKMPRRDGNWSHWIWLILLLVLTPLYRPYARLMLPLIAAGWVAYGGLIDGLVQRSNGQSGAGDPVMDRSRVQWLCAWLAGAAGAFAVYWMQLRPVDPGDSQTLASACQNVLQLVPGDERLQTYVRPPALYHLYLAGGARIVGPGDPADRAAFRSFLIDRTAPVFLVVDLALAADNPSLVAGLEEAGARLVEVKRFSYTPAAPVVLDDFGRAMSLRARPAIQQRYQLIVYRRDPDRLETSIPAR